MLGIDEEYELSEGSEALCAFHWPESLTISHPLFARRMLELQRALIKHHMVVMLPSDKNRAIKTLRFLDKQIKLL